MFHRQSNLIMPAIYMLKMTRPSSFLPFPTSLLSLSPFPSPQVNLEYLGRVVFHSNGLIYPDSLVGTDSHTTMINGLGIMGWGEGEAPHSSHLTVM